MECLRLRHELFVSTHMMFKENLFPFEKKIVQDVQENCEIRMELIFLGIKIR